MKAHAEYEETMEIMIEDGIERSIDRVRELFSSNSDLAGILREEEFDMRDLILLMQGGCCT